VHTGSFVLVMACAFADLISILIVTQADTLHATLHCHTLGPSSSTGASQLPVA
jgi:hypothetical protein